jgi:hypothetical protein
MRLTWQAAVPLLSIGVVACGSNATSPTPEPTPTPTPPVAVLEHHAGPRRQGLYLEPTLTRAVAATMQLDPSFAGIVKGNVYAQPLYVADGPGGRGTFFVATEDDEVDAIDEATGATVWTRSLGPPAPRTGAGCGNVTPLGVTGTPVIDATSRTLYVSAVNGSTRIDTHRVHALSIDDGSEQPGWPFDVSTVSFQGLAFDPVPQNQRGALTIADGVLYVPFGGHAGDCGPYHGWVVAIPLDAPSAATAWATDARGGGIWSPGGLATDGTFVFAATGNTFGVDTWRGGEAIVRLQKGAVFSGTAPDYFTPSNWKALDDRDVDIGGSGPVLFDVPGATPSTLVAALGKNGVVYLLDRTNLGGIGKGDGYRGEGLFSAHVASRQIINAAAVYTTPSGVHLVFHGYRGSVGTQCPAGQSGDLVSLHITATSPPTAITDWCADSRGQGFPIVTTTDGVAESLVWVAGAEGSNRLHAWNGETGTLVFNGGADTDLMKGLRRFGTPVAVNGRIFVAADNRLYAFKPR